METWHGEQGPLNDRIFCGVSDDHSVYDRGTGFRYFLLPMHCTRDGEQLVMDEENQGWVCPAHGDLVPAEWERQHEDALIISLGGILKKEK